MCRTNSFNAQWRAPQVCRSIDMGHNDRRCPVDRHIAIIETQGRGNHARLHVLVQTQGVPVDCLGVQCGIFAPIDGDLGELFAGRAVAIEMLLRK